MIFVIALPKLGKNNFRVVTVSSIILEHMVLFDLLVEQFGTMCSIPSQVHLDANSTPPRTRKHILFLNKNISLVREYYMKVYTQRVASTTVWTLQVKKIPKCFDIIIQNSRNLRFKQTKIV